MPGTLGVLEGLAYKHDWNTQLALNAANEQADNEAKQNAAAKAQFYGNQLAVKTLNTRYDNQQLKTYAEGQLKEIGKYAMANQDLEYNPVKWGEFQGMMNSLSDNEWVTRSVNATNQYSALIKYINEHPGAENDPSIQAQMSEWKNYNDTGSVDGVSTNLKGFYFRDPASQFDSQGAIADAFGKLKAQESYDPNGVGIGATKKEVSAGELQATAIGLLTGPNGFNFKTQWNSDPNLQSFYGNDIMSWLTKTGKSYTESDVTAGRVFAPSEMGASSSSSGGTGADAYSPFYNDIGNMPAWSPTFLPNSSSIIPIQDGKLNLNGGAIRITMADANGNQSFNVLKSYGTQPLAATSLNRVMTDGYGNTYGLASIKIPMTYNGELFQGDNPILKGTQSMLESWDANEANDTDINDAYKGTASFELNAAGERTGNLIVQGYVPVPVNSGTIRAYDVAASGQTNANKVEGAALNQMNQDQLLKYFQGQGGTGQYGVDNSSGDFVYQKSDGKWYNATSGTEYVSK